MFEQLLGQFGNKFAGSLGESLGGAITGGQAGPSNATAAVYGSGLDGSGWAVNFSGFQSASSAANKAQGGESLGTTLSGVPAAAWLAVGALVVVAAWKKRSKSGK